MSYRLGLLALAIILIVIGLALQYLAPVDAVGFLGYIFIVVGVIVGIVWLVLVVLDAIRANA